MAAEVLFQLPRNAVAANAEYVVTPSRLRCQGRVYEVANIRSVAVRRGELRLLRAGVVAFFLLGAALAVVEHNFVVLPFMLLVPGLLIAWSLHRKTWCRWNAFVLFEETEDIIMHGDSDALCAALIGVDHRTACEFAEAVTRAARELDQKP